jgi:hypothetical protein
MMSYKFPDARDAIASLGEWAGFEQVDSPTVQKVARENTVPKAADPQAIC